MLSEEVLNYQRVSRGLGDIKRWLRLNLNLTSSKHTTYSNTSLSLSTSEAIKSSLRSVQVEEFYETLRRLSLEGWEFDCYDKGTYQNTISNYLSITLTLAAALNKGIMSKGSEFDLKESFDIISKGLRMEIDLYYEVDVDFIYIEGCYVRPTGVRYISTRFTISGKVGDLIFTLPDSNVSVILLDLGSPHISPLMWEYMERQVEISVSKLIHPPFTIYNDLYLTGNSPSVRGNKKGLLELHNPYLGREKLCRNIQNLSHLLIFNVLQPNEPQLLVDLEHPHKLISEVSAAIGELGLPEFTNLALQNVRSLYCLYNVIPESKLEKLVSFLGDEEDLRNEFTQIIGKGYLPTLDARSKGIHSKGLHLSTRFMIDNESITLENLKWVPLSRILNQIWDYTRLSHHERGALSKEVMVKMYPNYQFFNEDNFPFEVVEGGEAIAKAYRECVNKGRLGESCLRHDYCQERIENFYEGNVGVVRLAVIRNKKLIGKNNIVSRCLLWETDQGLVAIDRIYSSSEIDRYMLKKCELLIKGEGKTSIYLLGPELSGSVLEDVVSVTLREWQFKSTPYMDSLTFMTLDGVLHNRPSIIEFLKKTKYPMPEEFSQYKERGWECEHISNLNSEGVRIRCLNREHMQGINTRIVLSAYGYQFNALGDIMEVEDRSTLLKGFMLGDEEECHEGEVSGDDEMLDAVIPRREITFRERYDDSQFHVTMQTSPTSTENSIEGIEGGVEEDSEEEFDITQINNDPQVTDSILGSFSTLDVMRRVARYLNYGAIYQEHLNHLLMSYNRTGREESREEVNEEA